MIDTIKPKNDKPIKIKINKTVTKIHKGTCYICGKDGHYQEDCNYEVSSDDIHNNEPLPIGNDLLVNNLDDVYGKSKIITNLSEIELPNNNDISFDYNNNDNNNINFKY
jgi:hypothetical protein